MYTMGIVLRKTGKEDRLNVLLWQHKKDNTMAIVLRKTCKEKCVTLIPHKRERLEMNRQSDGTRKYLELKYTCQRVGVNFSCTRESICRNGGDTPISLNIMLLRNSQMVLSDTALITPLWLSQYTYYRNDKKMSKTLIFHIVNGLQSFHFKTGIYKYLHVAVLACINGKKNTLLPWNLHNTNSKLTSVMKAS